MSEALSESQEITKSWVVVGSAKKSADNEDCASGVEELNPDKGAQGDSDTDSISVISESGCSYKTDEEEFIAASFISDKEDEGDSNPEIAPEVVESLNSDLSDDNGRVEKLFYLATSTVCAVILIGFSVAVQQYFKGSVDIDGYNSDPGNSDFSAISYCVQGDRKGDLGENGYVQSNKKHEGHFRKNHKRKHNFVEAELQIKNDDSVAASKLQNENLVLKVDRGSNYKPDESKRFKFPSDENLQKKYKRVSKVEKPKDNDAKYDEYNKKMEELKIKEEYLREKEKFLIKKEHDLLKREIKIKEECQNNKGAKDSKHKDKESKKKFKINDEIADKSHKNKDKDLKKNNLQIPQKFKYSDKKQNMTGQWYTNMHKARKNFRQKEQASDWLFDRAHLRSLKRNKAHWYFQWMVDRERLRMK